MTAYEPCTEPPVQLVDLCRVSPSRLQRRYRPERLPGGRCRLWEVTGQGQTNMALNNKQQCSVEGIMHPELG